MPGLQSAAVVSIVKRSAQRPLRPIPIAAAARIAKAYGYDQVVIIARRAGEPPAPHGEHVTTYGVDRAHCASAALQGRALRRFMGWPELEATPVAALPTDPGSAANEGRPSTLPR